MNSLHLQAAARQTAALSPRMQHAVKLLQMSSLEFAALMRDVAGTNPFLEVGEAEADGEDAPRHEDHGDDRDLWRAEIGSGGLRQAGDDELEAMDRVAAAPTLSASLRTQINVLPLDERDRALALTIIESLDDDGYLRTPLEDLLHLPGLLPSPTLQEMDIALRRVQALEPGGVGARSVAECLQLQMPTIACPQMRDMASTIVRDHLAALAARDVAQLARKLQAPVAVVDQVCQRIRRLDPRPGWRMGSSAVEAIVPDLTVKKVRGHWSVQLNPAVVPRLQLNQIYAALFQRHRTAQHAEMGDHLQEARWTLRNLQQRFATILNVGEAIVARQRGFLDYGAMAMKPLCLKEIADEVGLHASTICRATNNKYIATPLGVFELKFFFSRPIVSTNSRACSGTAIRGLVREMLEGEDPRQPLADAEIARMLGTQGLSVARRTVTKYRQMLRLPAAEQRRQHAREAA
ncbi:MAG TPA: RNA polymerase factor sigma-54 [Roseateles sp.]